MRYYCPQFLHGNSANSLKKSVLSYRSTVLPQPFHNDPADQIIVATAREENATILTKDERILAYKNVRSFW